MDMPLTPEEVEKRIGSLDQWVAHIVTSVDHLHDLVAKSLEAGVRADERIAELAAAQTELAAAQKRTEEALRKFIERGPSSNGHT